ncbi:MAG: hypothetical protein A3J76_06090 [Candidatus Moranbacteria bacterium RBG_13_45_13]|nr:MAG: hypothetical protein A3J76_06090 [Candidatus Moranbacteria bacterium RBG_13_45_13]
MNKTKKTIASFLLIVFLTISWAPSARAEYWGTNMMSTIYQLTVEKIQKQIYETILANLRIVAIRIIQGRLMTLLTGSPGGGGMGTSGMIISDWRQFIYGSAQKYSTQVTNDFFRNIRSGTPSALQQNVINPAERAVNTDYWGMRPDLQNYVSEGRASNIFNPGATSNPWMAWRMAAMPQNDLAFTYLRAMSFQQEAFRTEEEKKKAEGVAGQGYKSVTASNGKQVTVPSGSDYKGSQNITTPASTVGALVNKGLGMNLDTVSLTQSIPDIVSNMVVGMLTQFLNQGLVKITQTIDQQIMQIRAQTGLPAIQIQNFIQSGARTAPNPSSLPASSLPSGWNRGGQD